MIVKDMGVRGAIKVTQTLPGALENAGFGVIKQQEFNTEEVNFTLWVCTENNQ